MQPLWRACARPFTGLQPVPVTVPREGPLARRPAVPKEIPVSPDETVPVRRRSNGPRQRRISAILRGFTHKGQAHPTIDDLSRAFDTRAFGAFFILFGGINLVPLPPGGSFLFGVPLLLFTIQLAIGRHRLWLPGRVRRARISPEILATVMGKIGPHLRKVERLARHRYWPQPEKAVLCAVGWFAFLMAVLVAIPMPLTNMIPGVSIALSGIAISARDGLWLVASVVVGLGSMVLLAGVYGAALAALLHFL